MSSTALIRLVAAVFAMAAASVAQSQTSAKYPDHPVTLVVAYPPGGPPDLVARIIAPAIGDALGAPVVVENKPGAGGVIGFGAVARAAPDGYTLLLADLSLIVDPFVYAKPGYDPLKDLTYVGPVTRSYMTMLVRPDYPAKTVADFIAMAKAKPGEIRFGTSGVGSPPYLGGLAFQNATGVSLLHVPYRGIALAINDVIAGEIATAWMSFGPAAGQVKAGTLRALGVFGKDRLISIPDVPTFKEDGLDMGAADNGNWLGIAAPAGMSPDLVAKINAAVNTAVRRKDVQEHLENADYVNSDGGTPEQFKAIVAESVGYWAKLFEKAGVKPE